MILRMGERQVRVRRCFLWPGFARWIVTPQILKEVVSVAGNPVAVR